MLSVIAVRRVASSIFRLPTTSMSISSSPPAAANSSSSFFPSVAVGIASIRPRSPLIRCSYGASASGFSRNSTDLLASFSASPAICFSSASTAGRSTYRNSRNPITSPRARRNSASDATKSLICSYRFAPTVESSFFASPDVLSNRCCVVRRTRTTLSNSSTAAAAALRISASGPARLLASSWLSQ